MGTKRRSRRVTAQIRRRGRMPSQAVVTDDEWAKLADESLELATATFEAAAETWPSDTPLFPEGIGEVLHDLAHPTPLAEQDGPPWVHHFPAPRKERNDDA